MRHWLKIIALLWVLAAPAFAAETPERKFDAQKLEAYRNDPAFNYTGGQARSDSRIALLQAWLSARMASLLNALAIRGITPVLLQVLLLAAIATAVYLIVRIRFAGVLVKRSKNLDHTILSYPAAEKKDYEKLLRETLQAKQFKLAVRYLFLTALGTLEQQRKIKITQWKTPYDYLKELPEEKRTIFKDLTDLFENTWYGDYMPDRDAVDLGLQWYHQLENA